MPDPEPDPEPTGDGTEGDENSLPEETTTVFPEEEDPSNA